MIPLIVTVAHLLVCIGCPHCPSALLVHICWRICVAHQHCLSALSINIAHPHYSSTLLDHFVPLATALSDHSRSPSNTAGRSHDALNRKCLFNLERFEQFFNSLDSLITLLRFNLCIFHKSLQMVETRLRRTDCSWNTLSSDSAIRNRWNYLMHRFRTSKFNGKVYKRLFERDSTEVLLW